MPIPTLPVASTVMASVPAAETWKGLSVEPDAVVALTRYPVPVLFRVSVKLKRLFAPVAAFQVKVVVQAAILKERFPAGSVNALQTEEPPPAPSICSQVLVS